MILSKPLKLSIGFHFLLLLGTVGVHFFSSKKTVENVSVEVYEIPAPVQQSLQLQPKKIPEEKKPDPPPESKPREVFGLSRKSHEDSSAEAAVSVKQGNTIAKEQDNLKLEKDDLDNIPIPADDYLVTAMPVLLSYFKPEYTLEAKNAGIEGVVVIEMIIDDQGVVRDAKIIRGLGFGLDERTLEAAKKAKFKPGRVGDKAVAVKFRHRYTFELEN